MPSAVPMYWSGPRSMNSMKSSPAISSEVRTHRVQEMRVLARNGVAQIEQRTQVVHRWMAPQRLRRRALDERIGVVKRGQNKFAQGRR